VGRGIRGILSLGRAFKIMDDDNSRTLDINEYKKACRDYKFDLSDIEMEKAFVSFDRNGDGTIDYDEFLRIVRGNMNKFRLKFVDQAFSKMDKDGNGYLDINDIRGVYNARMHPDVKAGKKTEDEVLFEFIETFEAHHNLVAGEAADRIITKEEWIEYYENVSMSIDDDKYFELMMNQCWRINDHTTGRNEEKGWSNKDEGGKKSGGGVQDAYQKKREEILKKGGGESTEKKSGGQKESGEKESGQKQKSGQESKSQEPQGNVFQSTGEKESPVLEKFRAKILSRGGRGIIGLARQFKIFDDNNSKTLEYDEFVKAVRDFKVELSTNEIKVLFGIFDRDGEGTIDYDEFLRAIRGEMNQKRKRIAMQAFDKLDSDRSGVIEISEIKSLYNVKLHPDVKSGKKTEEEVYGEFLETFETHHNINKGTKDRRVTKEEFVEYYNNVSMSIDDDAYFELMMTNAWKLGKQNPQENQKGWSGDYTGDKKDVKPSVGGRPQTSGPPSQNAPWGSSKEPTNYSTSGRPNPGGSNFSKKGDEVLLKFREKLAARGTRGIMGIRRSFNICDDDGSKSIEFHEFSKLIKDYRIALNDVEIKKLFGIFDRDSSGSVDYDEFVKGVVGDMNDFRIGFVKKAFKKLDKNGNGTIELEDLKGVYSGRLHPDVRAGKKTEDEVLAEWLDNFEYHFSILNNNQSKDRSISLEEFIEYYNNISMSIEDDKYFELMMNSAWNLDNSKVTTKGWKGEI
jgi:Ca2+-binding EF-hand superfamily protein